MKPQPFALVLALLLVPSDAAHAGTVRGSNAFRTTGQADQDEKALVAAERAEADLLRRRGDLVGALAITDELLDDDEEDALTLAVRARIRFDRGELERAEKTVLEALAAARDAESRAAAGRVLADVLVRLGRAPEVLPLLEAVQFEDGKGGKPFLSPDTDPRDAWMLVTLKDAVGDRAAAEQFARTGAGTNPAEDDWRGLLAKARCQRRAGLLAAASQGLVQADQAARKAEGTEPDVLVELASLYFESEREIEAPGKRSAGNLLREALEIHGTHEDGLLVQFDLHRFNRRRVSKSPDEILGEIYAANPDSIRGLVAGASADLDDGKLVSVRAKLQRLDDLAPKRRDVRTLHAALSWVEHDRETTASLLEDLLKNAPLDPIPERTIGMHLSELYRFAESLDFLMAAVQRDPLDYEGWTALGESLANTGDEDGAREALAKAEEAARGRRDAFRSNLTLVLERMQRSHRTESKGALSFSWQPDAAEVLGTYLVPYYTQAREELAKRYGFTPGPTTIAVFRKHEDFSVRSVGFAGFPALGVCFGPVVTAVSPLSRLRGSFSWARTGFHEFSHVIHLGLSNNRCPRWITEGLATWEEVERNPTWTRNMRRDLVDAFASDDLIPLRELNRAFRGPRILFGYYQGGLLCEMLIDEHGFPPMIKLLRAFDLGADLDQAFKSVFDTTPEQVDADFHEFVKKKVENLHIEPRWSLSRVRRLQLRTPAEPPEGATARESWAEDWATIAYGSWQQGRRIDAESALQTLKNAGAEPVRALFLKAEMAGSRSDLLRAKRLWEEAIARGGRDYRALIALGQLYLAGSGSDGPADFEKAEATLLMAVEAFPGFDDGARSAERMLVDLYRLQDKGDEAMRWLEEWTRWNAGEYDARIEVAEWHVENGRDARAAELYAEANEVDMFRRDLHIDWAKTLERLGRFSEAAREYGVALAVPSKLDPAHVVFTGPADQLPQGVDPENLPASLLGDLPQEFLEPVPLSEEERAELVSLKAACEAKAQ
ncbi:hypothetical protein Poly30_23490 [Planctomycetes bacterium Poly30]|uniref:Tetratricopeptide repeat protein n=1 Tax=Saltatorellus ferox TaxID=2528018 RepID=A0A518ERW0_9BACT|nr:hypothetical protein Poly30_23490 [Planctomycetes bacterium Poly30]